MNKYLITSPAYQSCCEMMFRCYYVVLSLLNVCFKVESYFSINEEDIEEICNRKGPVNDEFFTGKVHYGYSRESGEVKVGNHPVTYDKDCNIIMKILAKPNAAKNSIGVTSRVERLGLRIAAPPEERKANSEMLKFLAKILGISISTLTIIEETGNFKTVKVTSGKIMIEELLKKLMDAQYMNTAYIGHPDYMKIDCIDESGF